MANSTNWPFDPNINDTWAKVLAAAVTGYPGHNYTNIFSTQKVDDPEFPPIPPNRIPSNVGALWSNAVDNFIRVTWPVIAGLVDSGFFRADGSVPMSGDIDVDGNDIVGLVNGTDSPTVGLKEYIGYTGNSGVFGDPTTFLVAGDPGDPGTYTVVGGVGAFRETASYDADLLIRPWGTSADREIAEGSFFYVGLKCIAGTVSIVEKAENTWDFLTEIPLGIIRNTATEGVTAINTPAQLANLGTFLTGRFLETQTFGRTTGLRLSTSGVSSYSLARSSGRGWFHQIPIEYPAYDSDPLAVDPKTFSQWYGNSGSGWTEVTGASTYDVDYYHDGAGGLAALTGGNFGVKWVYMDVATGDLLLTYGVSNSASLADAAAEAVPTEMPPGYEKTWILLGRIAFLQGEPAGALVDVWTETLPGGGPSGGGEANVGSNVGSLGQGLYVGKSGSALQFKNVAPGSSKLTVTPVATNNISFDVVSANVEAELVASPRPPSAHTHPYLPLDGSDAMSGDLDLDSNDILNVTQINGRDVLEDALALDWSSGTGVTEGASLSINGVDPTRFDISAGTLIFTDSYTSSTSTRTHVSYAGATSIAVTNLATDPITWVGINSSSTLVQQTTPFTSEQKRDIIYLGKLYHVDNTQITDVGPEQQSYIYPKEEMITFFDVFGPVNLSGNVYSAASTNLTIAKSAGTSWMFGANFQGSRKVASVTTDGAYSPASFRYVKRDGSSGFETGASVTNISPSLYDDGTGTLAAVPGGSWSIQWIFYDPTSGVTRVHYGQEVFSAKTAAIASSYTNKIEYDPVLNASTLCSRLVVLSGATDLSNSAQAEFFYAGKFGLQQVNSLPDIPSSAGTNTLDGLSDTPASKTGHEGKTLSVASDGSTTEYVGQTGTFVWYSQKNILTTAGTPVLARQHVECARWVPAQIRITVGTSPGASALTVDIKANGTSIVSGALPSIGVGSTTATQNLVTTPIAAGALLTVEPLGSDTVWKDLTIEASGTMRTA